MFLVAPISRCFVDHHRLAGLTLHPPRWVGMWVVVEAPESRQRRWNKTHCAIWRLCIYTLSLAKMGSAEFIWKRKSCRYVDNNAVQRWAMKFRVAGEAGLHATPC